MMYKRKNREERGMKGEIGCIEMVIRPNNSNSYLKPFENSNNIYSNSK